MILQLTVDHLHETIDVDYIISCDPLNRASTRRMNFARSELLYSKQGAIRAPDILYQHTPMSIQLLAPASSKLGDQVHCTLASTDRQRKCRLWNTPIRNSRSIFGFGICTVSIISSRTTRTDFPYGIQLLFVKVLEKGRGEFLDKVRPSYSFPRQVNWVS